MIRNDSTNAIPANTHFARDEECLRGGSYFRSTGRKKKDPFAQYMMGDFIGFVDNLPTHSPLQEWTGKEAKKLIPRPI